MDTTDFAERPLAVYGGVLLMAAVAYFVLSQSIIRHHGETALLKTAVGRDLKGKLSIALYAAAIALSLANRWIGFSIYWLVAVLWLVPDRRIERVVPE
jgi:uncharacterized membrane protein